MNNLTKLSALALAASCFAPLTTMAAERPNILLLYVDDWNDYLGSHFGKEVLTPNLDKLMDRGVSFTNCHTAASFSTPSRTATLTGMAPWVSGCYENHPHAYNLPDRVTLDELLQANGYKTYGTGKVYHHMPGYLNVEGFDEYFHWLPELREKGWGYDNWNKKNKAFPGVAPVGEMGRAVYSNFDIFALDNSVEDEMADTKSANWAKSVLERKHDDPFFLAVGMYAPHKPNYVPQHYFDLYPLDQIQLPAGVMEDNEDMMDMPEVIQRKYAGRQKNHHGGEGSTKGVTTVENGWKKAIQGYFAACSYADAQLGKVLDALEKSPYAKNTIVVFLSDNGYHLGEKRLWAKHTLWERGTNVPMIIAGGSAAKNKEYKGVVSLLDIFPTLIEECSLESKQPMDGVSLAGVLKNPKKLVDRYVITTNGCESFGVKNNEWHYNYHVIREGVTGEELYNAKEDLHEFNNLAQDPKYQSVLEQMRAQVPQNPVKPAVDRGELVLRFKGESYYYEPMPTNGTGKKKKK